MADISSITLPGGGTYDLKDKNAVPKYGMGKNLLRNWYFVGGGTGRGVFPVNQRGATTLNVGSTYFVDGWVTRNTTGSVAISSSGLSITTPSGLGARFALFQHIQLGNYASKPLTLSVLDLTKVYSVTVDSLSITDTSTRVIQISLDDGGLAELYVSTSDCYISLSSGIGKTSVYRAIKLELGPEQTLAHQENGVWVLNEIPDYEYELYRCITSTADSSDTYANKSLATEQQLAYVETGTTASRAYSVGEYFCRGGLLYRAKTAISSGSTFTPGTNCELYTISKLGIVGSNVSAFTFDGGTSVGIYEISFYFSNGERRILQILDSGSPKLRLQAYDGSAWSTKWSI